MSTKLSKVCLIVLATLALGCSLVSLVSPSRADSCFLNAPLKLADTQDGSIGQTGTVWTIEPDCTYSVARKTGPELSEPYRRGRLNPAQQNQFKEMLDKAQVGTLPDRVEQGPPVNARHIELNYDGKLSVLTLPPGRDDLGQVGARLQNNSAKRLVDLAAGVNSLAQQ